MRSFAGLLWLIVTGCTSIPNSERLSISFGAGELAPPVEVDIRCENGGCDSRDQLEASIYWDAAQTVDPTTAQVEILEYKVEYELFDVPDAVPYYANVTSVVVPPYAPVAFIIKSAGSAQRDFVRDLSPALPLDGIGTLTLAGYDHRNTIVEFSVDFDISFFDFVDDTP